jgi:hypothetical protein
MRFILRFLGLTGLLVCGIGALCGVAAFSSWDLPSLRAALEGQGDSLANYAAWLMVAGAGVALLVLALEALLGMFQAAGRRSALGTNVLVQIALVVALVVGANIWSFRNYRRYDLTKSRAFTLRPELVEQLRQLRGETTIVVYQQHKTFGRFSDKPPDRYDAAAERKVVEKVRDLVELFHEFGPQFRVVTLDVEEEGFDKKLSAEVERFPRLAASVESAPESSIFFCGNDHVQRLGFSEFLLLDKTSSQQSDGGRGNLVLLSQGIEPFARRLLAIEEKRPKVAVAVSHLWLSTDGPLAEYTLAGLKKSLEANGFDVQDVILKRLTGRRGRLEAAALTLDESRYDRAEALLLALSAQISRDQQSYDLFSKFLARLRTNVSTEELSKQLREERVIPPNATLTDDLREQNIQQISSRLPILREELSRLQQKRAEAERELDQLQEQERVVEGRRAQDLKKKLTSLLSECDMLVVARMTIRNAVVGDVVPNSIHQLEDVQVAAVKEFIKAGKPVMVCLGPTIEPPDRPGPPGSPTDNLETLMGDLGIGFGPQAIVFDSEIDAYTAYQVDPFSGGGGNVSVPPVIFSGPQAQNPVADSMRLLTRSAGKTLDLRLRSARPVYVSTIRGKLPHGAPFLLTDAGSWNEEQPYPTEDRPVPRYEPPKSDDPNRGTRQEKRRGPFDIGVAVETTVPVEWTDDRFLALNAARYVMSAPQVDGGLPMGFATQTLIPAEAFAKPSETKVRVAAIGHGGWFAGQKLTPSNEALLLQTTNWLLGRDDRLPKGIEMWSYPRLALQPAEQALWRWGTFLGLPGLFAYIGLVVLMIRRRR